jgi:hypothetical protein
MEHDNRLQQLRDYKEEEDKRKKKKKKKSKKNKDTEEVDIEEPTRQFHFESERQVKIDEIPDETKQFLPKWATERNGGSKGRDNASVNSKHVLWWLEHKPLKKSSVDKKKRCRRRTLARNFRAKAEQTAATSMAMEHKTRQAGGGHGNMGSGGYSRQYSR